MRRLVILLVAMATASPQARSGVQQPPQIGTGPTASLEVLQLRPNFYMIAGAGGNIGVQVGEDGVVVVDTGTTASADSVLAAIKAISPAPIRYVINTSADADHVGGNEALSKAGQAFVPLEGVAEQPAVILAPENVLSRMSARANKASSFGIASWPTQTFVGARTYMYLNGEGIEILHQPAAHTDGDSIVFFRRSDVIVAGDVIDTDRFPVISVGEGGSIQGEIDALNRLVAMAIPSVPITTREAGTSVIPGHGHVYDQFDVVAYRDMVTIVRDNVRDLMAAGMTLEQVKAALPAKGYMRRYGSDSGAWTTNDFIEAAYRSLARAKS